MSIGQVSKSRASSLLAPVSAAWRWRCLLLSQGIDCDVFEQASDCARWCGFEDLHEWCARSSRSWPDRSRSSRAASRPNGALSGFGALADRLASL